MLLLSYKFLTLSFPEARAFRISHHYDTKRLQA